MDDMHSSHTQAVYHICLGKESKMLDRVFICSPYRGNTKVNLDNAIRYCRMADVYSKLPIAPHVYFTRVFPDENAWHDRYIGMYWGKQLMADCKEIWIFCNELTEGMIEEIAEAKRLGIAMKFFNVNREEINDDNYLIHTEIGPAYRRLISQYYGESFYFAERIPDYAGKNHDQGESGERKNEEVSSRKDASVKTVCTVNAQNRGAITSLIKNVFGRCRLQ